MVPSPNSTWSFPALASSRSASRAAACNSSSLGLARLGSPKVGEQVDEQVRRRLVCSGGPNAGSSPLAIVDPSTQVAPAATTDHHRGRRRHSLRAPSTCLRVGL